MQLVYSHLPVPQRRLANIVAMREFSYGPAVMIIPMALGNYAGQIHTGHSQQNALLAASIVTVGIGLVSLAASQMARIAERRLKKLQGIPLDAELTIA